MKKQEYLNELRRHLSTLPKAEVDDIMADYEDHFAAGLEAGKTEEQICESLGTPRLVGQSHAVTSLIEEVHSAPSIFRRSELLLKILLRFCLLAPFNFLVLFGPFVGVLAVIVAGWAIPLAVGGASVAAGVTYLGAATGPGLGLFSNLSLFFLFLGVLGLCAMMGMIMLAVSRGFIHLVSSYVRWNINFINAKNA